MDQLQCSPEAGPQRHYALIHYQQASCQKHREHCSAHFRPLVCCPGETLMLHLQNMAFYDDSLYNCGNAFISAALPILMHEVGKELHKLGKDT